MPQSPKTITPGRTMTTLFVSYARRGPGVDVVISDLPWGNKGAKHLRKEFVLSLNNTVNRLRSEGNIVVVLDQEKGEWIGDAYQPHLSEAAISEQVKMPLFFL